MPEIMRARDRDRYRAYAGRAQRTVELISPAKIQSVPVELYRCAEAIYWEFRFLGGKMAGSQSSK
jgi:hypothetical protein